MYVVYITNIKGKHYFNYFWFFDVWWFIRHLNSISNDTKIYIYARIYAYEKVDRWHFLKKERKKNKNKNKNKIKRAMLCVLRPKVPKRVSFPFSFAERRRKNNDKRRREKKQRPAISCQKRNRMVYPLPSSYVSKYIFCLRN